MCMCVVLGREGGRGGGVNRRRQKEQTRVRIARQYSERDSGRGWEGARWRAAGRGGEREREREREKPRMHRASARPLARVVIKVPR
jgi:hypothetical protein